jgi:hypothetical protein
MSHLRPGRALLVKAFEQYCATYRFKEFSSGTGKPLNHDNTIYVTVME